MILSLDIQNFALIDKLHIDFKAGFSVITGETGAGKSILLGAVGLLLGRRAEVKDLKKGANRCVVEAHFCLTAYPWLKDFFVANELDYEAQDTILRREIQATGKSRAFINDTPVSLTLMRELGEQLIDIHSQHQNLMLHKENYQLEVLDTIAQNHTLVQEYQSTYREYKQLSAELESVTIEAQKGKAEQDYLVYQLNQLEEANLIPGEEESLKQESEVLLHAEEIKGGLYRAAQRLNGEEENAIQLIKNALQELQNLSRVSTHSEELAARTDSCLIELKDIASEIEALAEEIEYNPQRLEEVNARLDIIYSLEQKHRVGTVEELLNLAESFRTQLGRITSFEERIEELSKQQKLQYAVLIELAAKLTKVRIKGGAALENELCERLAPLGMPYVKFKVEITPRREPEVSGMDRITFLFTANKNADLQAVASVASGGEIARLMLCLKAMLAKVSKMPTLIFDEIDTGVSGEIAARMADIMQEMAHSMQVISITHLPQIAARGAMHYYVYKDEQGDATASHIRQLTQEERIQELAQMLSGAMVTEAALNNAKDLLKVYGTE